ncbi:hypothetical protein ACGFZP_12740 [Kitasatospora sp. NPDC048239]|uniref:hypothetical protein n=1 Tax=Kitasatospora sp. NPDC048239 TaxID=3364046 RepID=UPI00370FEE3D
MTPADHLRLLGPQLLAEIRRRAAAAPPPSAEVVAELRPILAPAMARVNADLSARSTEAPTRQSIAA